jgi:hypothetical protein
LATYVFQIFDRSNMLGSVAAAKVFPQAKDEHVARKLWEVSQQLTGVNWPAEEQSRELFTFPVKREA